MRRRAFIGIAGGGLVALAGCISTDSSGVKERSPGNKPTQTADPTPTATAEPGRAVHVTVQNLQLQYGIMTPSSPDSIGIDFPDTPYLVTRVRVNGSLSRDEFGLRMGDERYSPTRIDRLYRTSWGGDQWYKRGRDEGLVLFESPQPVTEHLQLTWPGGSRALSDSIVSRLNETPPPLSASLEVPDTHSSTEAPSVAVKVTNEGEIACRFLGALNRIGPLIAYTPVARLSRLVPAGETVTISVSDTWTGAPPDDVVGDGDPDVTYHLDYPGDETSAGIRIVDPA